LQVLLRFLQNRLLNILFSSILKKAKKWSNGRIILFLANRLKKRPNGNHVQSKRIPLFLTHSLSHTSSHTCLSWVNEPWMQWKEGKIFQRENVRQKKLDFYLIYIKKNFPYFIFVVFSITFLSCFFSFFLSSFLVCFFVSSFLVSLFLPFFVCFFLSFFLSFLLFLFFPHLIYSIFISFFFQGKLCL